MCDTRRETRKRCNQPVLVYVRTPPQYPRVPVRQHGSISARQHQPEHCGAVRNGRAVQYCVRASCRADGHRRRQDGAVRVTRRQRRSGDRRKDGIVHTHTHRGGVVLGLLKKDSDPLPVTLILEHPQHSTPAEDWHAARDAAHQHGREQQWQLT